MVIFQSRLIPDLSPSFRSSKYSELQCTCHKLILCMGRPVLDAPTHDMIVHRTSHTSFQIPGPPIFCICNNKMLGIALRQGKVEILINAHQKYNCYIIFLCDVHSCCVHLTRPLLAICGRGGWLATIIHVQPSIRCVIYIPDLSPD